jgi:hypothetical protein
MESRLARNAPSHVSLPYKRLVWGCDSKSAKGLLTDRAPSQSTSTVEGAPHPLLSIWQPTTEEWKGVAQRDP